MTSDDLTIREHQIVTLIAAGLSNKEIAHSIGTTEGTVKAHLFKIYRKLDIKGRVALAVLHLRRQEKAA